MRKISPWLHRLETKRSNTRRDRPELNRFSWRRMRFRGRLLAVFATLPLGTSCQPDRVPVAIGEDVAFTVPDPLLIPEGIAFDAVTGDFFVGSTYRRKVVRISAGEHFLNDVAVGQNGVAYVTDSQARMVYRFDPSASVFETLADLSQYGGGPNGIDITPDGQSLYVAVGRGIVRVDLSSRRVTKMALEREPHVFALFFAHAR